MKIVDALSGVRRLGIDTPPLIYYTEQRAGYVDKVRAVFQRVFEEGIETSASTILFTELLAKPLKEQDDVLVMAYRTMLESMEGFMLYPVDVAIAEHAAHLRARYNLKTPDALHLATAIEVGCQAFLTNDGDMQRVSGIRVLVLDDLELNS